MSMKTFERICKVMIVIMPLTAIAFAIYFNYLISQISR